VQNFAVNTKGPDKEHKRMKQFTGIFLFFSSVLVYSENAQLPDGSIYSGSLKDGRFYGYAKQVWSNGDIFEGEYLNGKYNGSGKLTTKFYIYEGQFKDGLINGKGMITYRNGIVYQGQFLNGLYDGIGSLTDAAGNIFTGNFTDGIRSGEGQLLLKNGDSYKGEYLNDIFHGKGIYMRANGEYYIGEFKNGLFDGEGKYYIALAELLCEGIFHAGNFPKEYYEKQQLENSLQSFERILLFILLSVCVVLFLRLRKFKKQNYKRNH
jgi:hypothetical protein